MRILVTGASGFAGGAIATALMEGGHEVVGLARSEAAAERIAALGAAVARGSVADPNEVAEAARCCELVVHAAGIASPRAAPRALYWTHVAGTENVLRGAEHAGASRLLFVSCLDATLQDAAREGWDEDRAPEGRPLGHRARSLQLAEEAVVGSSRPGHFETLVLRPAWLWGAGDSSTLPALVAQVLRHGPLRLPGGGSYLLATTHVGNLAHAARLAAEAPSWEGHGLLHVLDAELLLASEFFTALCRAAGLPPPRRGAPATWQLLGARLRRWLRLPGPLPEEVARRALPTVVEGRRIETLLGYAAVVRFEEGMAALAEWVRAIGGPEALAARLRPPPGEAEVEAQVRAAEALG